MIKGYCHTNLDGYERVVWPTVFAAVPRIGDRVTGVSGSERHSLKVVGITHEETLQNGNGSFMEQTPILSIELHR